ncbi:MAG: imidazolonepropionase [Glaciecola sp.]|jgi:imidazolonepropionase|uniref:imidazolonepropionase n=1 Tax=Congregibacter sp. TaxID=2744308 RepID=UPI0039E23B81
MKLDTLIDNIRLPSTGRSTSAVGVRAGQICWVGESAPQLTADTVVDGNGGWLTPGLIDSHTHLVYAGNRSAEFAERLRGVPYTEIARRGGGILSTVAATRKASEQELYELSLPRLNSLAAEGVCTIEIKSGYGLDLNNELKMLRVARSLGESSGIHVVTTLLAAHALPAEFDGQPDRYIDLVCNEILPAAAAEGLADAVDVFCESIAFTPGQCERVFQAATELGLPIKGHVEQLSYSGGAQLVARYGGLSVDHIEYLQEQDLAVLAKDHTPCVLLPGAFYTLRETQKPPVDLMRKAGLPLVVASDLNPGSSPIASLRMNMNMACVLFGLTAEETLLGVTVHAAAALGLADRKGRVAAGFDADLVLWDIDDLAELSYGHQLVGPAGIWRGGVYVE